MARAFRAAQSVISLGKGTRGRGIGNARKFYIPCSRQIAEYGGKVWWKGQKGLAAKIDKVNIQAMRRIGGHFKSAPTAVIEVENDMITTEHRFNHKERMQAIKGLKHAPNHPIYKAVKDEISELIEEEDTWRAGRRRGQGRRRGVKGAVKSLAKIVGKNCKKIESWKSYYESERKWEKKVREEIEIDIRPYDKKEIEKKRQEERREQEGEIVMYSDGSKVMECVAVVVCRIGNDGGVLRKIGYRLGKKMEIMDAEIVGIKKAIEVGLKEAAKERKKTITIRWDSQESIRRVKRRHEASRKMMAHKIRYWYDAGKTQKVRIRLEWVKGHSKIKGNLEADKAAKKAINKGRVDKEWFVSFAFLERESREETIGEWETEWETRANKEKALLKPSQRNTIKFDDTDRMNRVIISHLRTGHIAINRYLKRIGKIESAECKCGKGE